MQRVQSALEEAGITRETALAALAVRPGDPVDVLARARAIDKIRQSPDFEGLMVGYRRAANLVRTAPPEDVSISGQPLAERAENFGEKVEADLHPSQRWRGKPWRRIFNLRRGLRGSLETHAGPASRHRFLLRRGHVMAEIPSPPPEARVARGGEADVPESRFLSPPTAPGQKSFDLPGF